MIAYIHNTQELYLDLTKYYDLHVTMKNVQYNTTIHTQYKQCIAFLRLCISFLLNRVFSVVISMHNTDKAFRTPTMLGENALSRGIEAIYSNDTARTALFMDFIIYKGNLYSYIIL